MLLIGLLLCAAVGCGSSAAPGSAEVQPDPNTSVGSPVRNGNSALPFKFDPCAAVDGWQSLAFRDPAVGKQLVSDWWTVADLHFNHAQGFLYAFANRLLTEFKIFQRMEGDEWKPIYSFTTDFKEAPEGGLFGFLLPGSSAYDAARDMLYFSVLDDDIMRLDATTIIEKQYFPANLQPAERLAIDTLGKQLYVFHPGGILGRSFDSDVWRTVATAADFSSLPLTQLRVFHTADGTPLLCAMSYTAVTCRLGFGPWAELAVVDNKVPDGSFTDLDYDIVNDRLFAVKDGRLLVSEGLSGWYLNGGAVSAADEIEFVTGKGLYVRVGLDFFLSDTLNTLFHLYRLPSPPFQEFNLRGFRMAVGESFGFVMTDEDGCPTADQICQGSEIYAVCLQ